ncbi:MAG: transposase family protein [Flavonifractor plautii]
MALFAESYQDYLRKYIELKNGIPSHDTIRRVMGMISPEIIQQLYGKWQDRLNQNEGELLKKIICIDGKTMRSNKRGEVGRHPTLYQHGVKSQVSVLDKKQLKKKQ